MSKIFYDNPTYAIDQAFGKNQWNIFLNAYENEEYTYID